MNVNVDKSRVTAVISTAETVTVHVAETEPFATVTIAVPSATGVTTPVEETEEPEQEAVDEEAELAALLEKIDSARNAAIEAGAQEAAPDLLKKVDEYLEKCKADGTLKENAADIIARYELLSNLVKAQQAKKEIDENDFAQYDQKD